MEIDRNCIRDAEDNLKRKMNGCSQIYLKKKQIIDCYCKDNYCNSKSYDSTNVSYQVGVNDRQ